jgi:outer membrane protein OmpA-like peptidoglycan-associated protein
LTASRRVLAPLVFCLLVAVAACSKQTAQTTTVSPAPSASVAAESSPAASASPADTGSPAPETSAGSAGPAAEPTATPTATPVPNLLLSESGTIVRSYPAEVNDVRAIAANGFDVSATGSGPWVVVYELPGVATLSSVSARLPMQTTDDQGSTATFAVSTTSATAGFSDVGSVKSAQQSATSDTPQVALSGQRARWLRVTVTRAGKQQLIRGISAYGVMPPSTAAIAGTYVTYAEPYKQGVFVSAPSEADPWYLHVVSFGAEVNAQRCFDGHAGDDGYPGTFDGRTWKRADGTPMFIANDDGTMLVNVQGSPVYWVRTTRQPKFCAPQVLGSGTTNVLVLEGNGFPRLYPLDAENVKSFRGLRFTEIGAAMMDQKLLDGASTVIFNAICNADDTLAPAQNDAIARWVEQGHKLLIYDADTCGKPTHYGALPYQFVSNNPGAQGAHGDKLIQVEDDTLGTSDKTDKAHFFDPQVYATGSNQLGDANTVTTHDPHWCGHLFGTNVNHVNGFMQMYAPYGKGLIIYDGFDHDDGDLPSNQRLRQLEFAQQVPADLPCTQKASLAFVIEPNRDGTFVPGKAVTKPFAMELLANQGWKGHVNVTTSGDFKAAVTPSSFDVNGNTQPLKIAVSIPANAKPGTYAIIVNGDGGSGQTAQATIQFHANVPMLKQIKTQRRIRIYGIHFDVDKATIKPQSEPVIAQIAQVMQQDKTLRFRVEGHTDSDGGLAHNKVLSQHRAESVVNDLVKRYHIAKSRLVPAGFGYSKPVAPNTTSAGKALNRRVELFLLSGK